MPRRKSRNLLPNDFGDILSIISAFGFIAIFFKFALDNPILSDLTTPFFLIFGGAGLMIVGKVFTIKHWVRDGVQSSEYSQIFAIIFGLASIIIGILLWIGIALPLTIQGWVGLFALPPAIYIMIDYFIVNTKGVC